MKSTAEWLMLPILLVILFVPGIARALAHIIIWWALNVEWFYLEIPLAWSALMYKRKADFSRIGIVRGKIANHE